MAPSCTCWPLPACFGFLGRQKRGPPRLDTKFMQEECGNQAQRLPKLDEACAEIRRTCGGRLALAQRRCQVTAALLPVTACITRDLLRKAGPRHAEANTRRLRLALEALGPAFVKLGQAAACREDVLSDVVAAELRKLCDQVAPYPNEDAKAMIREELGSLAPSSIGEVVAAASLGQVYRVTIDGQEYAMKVQRPGLARALAMDVLILQGLGRFLRRILRQMCETPVDPVDVIDNWADTFWNEIDYLKEAEAMDDMRRSLANIKGLVIPPVNWRLSSLRVLTTKWVHGVKVTQDPKCVRALHINIGIEAFASMILSVGVVHADPHPGNMIITGEGKKVCLLDFGMTVQVPPAHRKAWAKCVVHLVRQEHEAVLDDLIDIGFFPQDCPRDKILPVMSKIWRQLVESGSDIRKRKRAVEDLYKEIMVLVRTFKFDLPDYYVALVRALVTLEGIALAADVDFDIFQAIFPVALRFLGSASAADSAAIGQALLVTGARHTGQAIVAGLCTRRAASVAVTGALLVAIVWTQLTAAQAAGQ